MSGNRLILAAVALFLLPILAQLPALDAGFIWDDDAYLTDNEVLRRPDGLAKIWFDPGATPQYYPLVFTSYWLEYRLWGLDPTGYHLVNLLLQGIVALLLWAALRKLEINPAWLITAAFALHPVHVESVAWIAERKNVLSGAFYLLSLLLFLRACAPFRRDAPPVRKAAYVASLLLFLCALWSKTVTSSLPAVLLLLLWWKRGMVPKRIFGLTAPYFFLGALFAGITVWMERTHVGAQGLAWDLGPIDRILIAGRALWFYIAKLIVPTDLAFIYPRWQIDPSAWWQYLFPAGFGLLLLAFWRWRARLSRGPLVALLFFAGTLVPALGFFDVYPMRYSFVADHFQYLASIGLLALIVSALWRLLLRIGRSDHRIAWGVGGVLLLALGVTTFGRAEVFRDPERLWLDTLSKNPGAWMAHHNLAMVHEERQDWEQAVASYREAIRLRPDLSQSHFNLGTILAQRSDWDAAREHFELAVDVEPGYVDAHVHLANVLYAQGNFAEAVEVYRRALEIDPNKLSATKNLALTLSRLGRWEEAVAAYRVARRLDPSDPQTADRFARLLATVPVDAARDGEEAVQLAESLCSSTGFRNGPFLVTLAAAYAETGRFEEAVSTIDRAIEIAVAGGVEQAIPELEAARSSYLEEKPMRLP